MSLSPFTFEAKLRYISALLFLVFSLKSFFSFDPLDLGLNYETGFAFAYGFYAFVMLLIWSLFDRWYFMVSAMVVLVVLTFFTVVIGVVHSHFITEGEMILPISFITVGLAFASYGMYTYRNTRNNSRSARYNFWLGTVMVFSPAVPILILFLGAITAWFGM